MKSVRFADAKMVEKFKKIELISGYVNQKLAELDSYNREKHVDMSNNINRRNITNLGTFRKYLEFYLVDHPKIIKEMTLMVRQLQPTEQGIPIEVYAFSNDTKWVNYEIIQSDIFDHIIAVIPEFGLRVFQNPTGDDFQKAFRNQ